MTVPDIDAAIDLDEAMMWARFAGFVPPEALAPPTVPADAAEADLIPSHGLRYHCSACDVYGYLEPGDT